MQLSRMEERHAASLGRQEEAAAQAAAAQLTYLEPTQKLSDVKGLALFPD